MIHRATGGEGVGNGEEDNLHICPFSRGIVVLRDAARGDVILVGDVRAQLRRKGGSLKLEMGEGFQWAYEKARPSGKLLPALSLVILAKQLSRFGQGLQRDLEPQRLH
jgi:hypothetical protein